VDESFVRMLTAGASSLGIELDEAAVTRFSTYLRLLQLWGRKINLTTRLETEEVVLYHFLDSLSGVPILAASAQGRVVDLGAGAGLPSFPLKFALPGLHLLLVESVRKKVAFCQEVTRATGCADVEVAWGRGEILGSHPKHRNRYDWAVSRALGPAAEVAALALPFLAPRGRILLYKGNPESGELRGLDVFCAEHAAAWVRVPVSVPHLKGPRCLIEISFPKSSLRGGQSSGAVASSGP
jgi:16S rRNA (guanine527-N7)-methyltransferase